MAAKSPKGRSVFRFAVLSWRGQGAIIDRRFSSFADLPSAKVRADAMASRGFTSRVIDLDSSAAVYQALSR